MLDLFETNWIELWGDEAGQESVGAVFTKPEIVRLILDLLDYTPSGKRLARYPVLEPSCGDGAFLTEVVARLIRSEASHTSSAGWEDPILDRALRAADIDIQSLHAARVSIAEQLIAAGCPSERASELADVWTVHTDFLLHRWDQRFDFVVGNPPYVRIESLPRRVLSRYRELFETATDRADLYVAFFEQGLQLLSPTGVLGFICANRFTKNTYGTKLRRLISSRYRVKYYINLEHTQPFVQDVSAYPAIFIIDREQGESTLATTLNDLNSSTLETVRRPLSIAGTGARILNMFREWYPGGAPWVSTSNEEQRALADLAERHCLVEESAAETVIGIGVATGADSVFVLQSKHGDIEDSRQIPLIVAADVKNESITWSGHYLLNPFSDLAGGGLVDLEEYPGLERYLASHKDKLMRRHVSKARPHAWYRTIDRIWPSLARKKKLVIPDIQSGHTVGLDDGNFYPHHNLYWIASESWDIRALKTLMRSSLVLRQVRAYSVQMRGGSVRFQAQTLRRVRIPQFERLSKEIVTALAEVSDESSQQLIDEAACLAFDV